MSEEKKILTLVKDEHAVAILTYDLPGRPMNVITEKTDQELNEMLDLIAKDDEIRSVVLTGKPANFLAGAD
ncbi:MAG: enoyl-CoA hydratase-related protein, partial [Desulfobacterales bacterium]